MKKNLFLSIALITLLALTFISCDSSGDGISNEPDIWLEITDPTVLDGTWRGSDTQNFLDWAISQGFGSGFSPDFAADISDIVITQTFTATWNFDTDAGTFSRNVQLVNSYSGRNIDRFWTNFILPNYRDNPFVDRSEWIVDDRTRTVTYPPWPFSGIASAGQFAWYRINQFDNRLLPPSGSSYGHVVFTKLN